MPELPEVETIRRQLHDRVTGRQLLDSWSHPSPKFSEAPSATGRTIERLGRRGKYLIASLDDDHELIVHLGMTGSVRVIDRDADEPTPDRSDPYVRAWWRLDDGADLIFRDVRRFGRIAVVASGDYDGLPTLASLGPEPFDPSFDPDHLWRELRTGTRHLKTKLLSQRPVAGLGNIYADEAFWLAQVNPADRTITRERAERLHGAIREVLASGLDHGGTTLRDYVDGTGGSGSNQHHLRCYGRSGLPCERCGGPIGSISLDARTTSWCGTCQPRRR